jgi:hypothetical protein
LRGYRKRHHFLFQLIAENVFASTYAFRGSEGNTPQKMFPMLFEDDDDYEMEPAITEEEQDELQALMAAENARLEEERKSKKNYTHLTELRMMEKLLSHHCQGC